MPAHFAAGGQEIISRENTAREPEKPDLSEATGTCALAWAVSTP
jgi:hypothetical protein